MNEINAWLDKHNARLMWHQPVRNVGTLSAYQVGEGIAYVMAYTGKGWDLFVPASLDTRIDATLAAAERALGLKP